MLYLYYLIALATVVLQIIVVVKVFQNEGALKGILALICGLYALIWGWMNAGRLGIKNLMIIWTVLLIILILMGGTMSMWMPGVSPSAP